MLLCMESPFPAATTVRTARHYLGYLGCRPCVRSAISAIGWFWPSGAPAARRTRPRGAADGVEEYRKNCPYGTLISVG
jgi:hypothetical protein